jgi:hypothetical protein
MNKWWAPLTPIDGTALMTKVISECILGVGGGKVPFPPSPEETEKTD